MTRIGFALVLASLTGLLASCDPQPECGPAVGSECAEGAACQVLPNLDGQCVDVSQVDGSGLCGGPEDVTCGDGFECVLPTNWPDAVGTCQPVPAPPLPLESAGPGEICGPAVGLDCDDTTACQIFGTLFGVCVPLDQIDGVGLCAGPFGVECEGEASCQVSDPDWPDAVGTCVEPSPPASGGACGDLFGATFSCSEGEACQYPAGIGSSVEGVLGTCVDVEEIDGIATCAGPNDVPCEGGFVCDVADEPEAVGTCVDPTPPPPSPPKQPGDVCNVLVPDDCDSGLVCTETFPGSFVGICEAV